MELSAADIRGILIGVIVLVVSVALHEFGHAIMADKLGDDTPRRQGRVTLNPLAHADPIGTILLPIMGGVYGAVNHTAGGFGWGRPVQWQPRKVTRKVSMATASILVAIAGPAMNLLLGTVLALVHQVLRAQGVVSYGTDPDSIFHFAVTTNFVLFFFNLVPAPPLDGGHVAQNLMPYRYRDRYESYAKFGPFVVMGVAMIPPLNKVFLVPAGFLADHVYSLMHAIFGG